MPTANTEVRECHALTTALRVIKQRAASKESAIPATATFREAEPDPTDLPDDERDTDVTGGAPPAVPNPSDGEEPTVGTENTGPAPGTAGTAEDAVALAEAQRARTEAEQARETALKEAFDAKAAADEARKELARLRATEAARALGGKELAESALPEAAKTRVLNEAVHVVPLTEALALDEAAFKAALAEAAKAEEAYLASLREAVGEGRVTGLGATAAASTAPDPEIRKGIAEMYRARGLSESAAQLAASGRPV